MKSFYLLLLPLVAAAPQQATPTKECKCAAAVCPQSFPESCFCQNEGQVKCWEQCDRDYEPPLQDCGGGAYFTSTPVPVPNCACKEEFCTADWPDSCLCSNTVKLECWMDCGGEQPRFQNCEGERVTIAQRVPSPSATGIPCGRSNDPSCPSGMNCQPLPNIRCFGNGPCPGTCVGVRATTSVTSSSAPAAPTTTAAPTPTQCGARLGDTCPSGWTCIDDPELETCGRECDRPGICVESCGGIMGKECPQGLDCYDVATDGCDPSDGGADCMGYCYKPGLQ